MTFLAEYTENDGGPRCMRDDCDITYSAVSVTSLTQPETHSTRVVRCLSCGKTWEEKIQNGTTVN